MSIVAGLRHYACVFYQWLWLIGLSITVCAGSTYIINISTAPVYEASALVRVHDASTTNNNIFTDQALAQSYALLVNRPTVLHAVVQRVPGLSFQQLETAVSSSPLENSQIIQVRATAQSPSLAATIANTVVDAFIKIQVDDETARLKSIAGKLYKNLTTAKQNVYADQVQLAALQDTHASADRIAHQNDVLSADQASYNSALINYDQIQQQLLQSSGTFSIAQAATAPSVPASPRTFLNTLVAAALGALTVIVLVLLLDWFDTSIKTADDAEQLGQITSLGSIPFHKSSPSSKYTGMLPLINSAIIEHSFIGIGINTVVLCQEQRSILITGLHERTGVSTVAINLATALARSGLRVLLVDANFRHPSLHQVLKHSNTSGLTTILTEIHSLREGTAQQIYSWLNQLSTHIPNLYFLPSGPRLPDASFATFIATVHTLQGRLLSPGGNSHPSRLVDVILFDSDALENSPATLTLASSVEASILVIDAGKVQPVDLQKASRLLHKLSCPPLGVIINRQKSKHTSYFYKHTAHQFAFTQEAQPFFTEKIPTDRFSQGVGTGDVSSLKSGTTAFTIDGANFSVAPHHSSHNQHFSKMLTMPYIFKE